MDIFADRQKRFRKQMLTVMEYTLEYEDVKELQGLRLLALEVARLALDLAREHYSMLTPLSVTQRADHHEGAMFISNYEHRLV